MGVDIDGNGIGEPVSVWRKPILSATSVSQKTGYGLPPLTLQTSDDFSDPTLGLQWQWNHNPDDAHWSLTERKGCLTIHAQKADNLKTCRNMLTQKVIGYQSQSRALPSRRMVNFNYFRKVFSVGCGYVLPTIATRIVISLPTVLTASTLPPSASPFRCAGATGRESAPPSSATAPTAKPVSMSLSGNNISPRHHHSVPLTHVTHIRIKIITESYFFPKHLEGQKNYPYICKKYKE